MQKQCQELFPDKFLEISWTHPGEFLDVLQEKYPGIGSGKTREFPGQFSESSLTLFLDAISTGNC